MKKKDFEWTFRIDKPFVKALGGGLGLIGFMIMADFSDLFIINIPISFGFIGLLFVLFGMWLFMYDI